MVEVLEPGEPIDPARVVEFVEGLAKAPFKAVATILLGSDHVQPCPVCRRRGTRLDVLDRAGRCYGRCGKVTLAQLFDIIYRPVEPPEGPRAATGRPQGDRAEAPPACKAGSQTSREIPRDHGRVRRGGPGRDGRDRPRTGASRRGHSIMAPGVPRPEAGVDAPRQPARPIRLGPVVGDRTRQIIWGVTPEGAFVDGMTLDGFLAQAGQILADSGRLYKFGNTIVLRDRRGRATSG